MLVTLLFIAYNLALILLLPFIVLRLFWRSRKAPAYRQRVLERFGWFKGPIHSGGLWVHCVSVGESVAALPIIQAFQQKNPGVPITVTTTTPTGSAQIQRTLGSSVFHVYCPYDFPWALNHFLNRIQPRLCVILETELWPNLLQALKKRNIPILLANARLSPKSHRRYKRLRPFMQVLLQNLDLIAAQTQQDADRFASLGADRQRLQIMGNVKFDVRSSKTSDPLDAQLQSIVASKRPTWIAASTHAGEESIILEAHAKLQNVFPDCLLILVPRHPERFSEVAKLLEQRPFEYARRSLKEAIGPKISVVLGDTMGELDQLYRAAQVAFVGGSLKPIGGHNLLEPARHSLAILTGPHLFNFQEISEQLLTVNGMRVVQTEQDLIQQVIEYWTHPEKRKGMGNRAKQMVEENSGAVDKVMNTIQMTWNQSLNAKT